MRTTKRWRGRRLVLACGAASLAALEAPLARADVLSDVGGFLGKPLGGFLGAASAPTITNAEGAANGVVANIDGRLNKDVVNAGAVVTGVADHAIAGVSQVGTAWLGQADGIIGANVARVFVDADATAARAIGQIGALEGKTADDVRGIVRQLDKSVQGDLDRADTILGTRITQIDGVVKNAVSEADGDVKARIDQADDAAQKALGSADVLAAKETLGVQAALLRVGALLGMIAFLVSALRYVFEHLKVHVDAMKAAANDPAAAWRQRRRFAAASVASLVVHAVFGAACMGLFFWLSESFPAKSEADARLLTSTHEKALGESLAALDFTKVRYHAAELAILNPAGEDRYRAVESRAELIRTVLSRPGLLATGDGVRQIATAIDDAKRAQVAPDGGTGESADVVTAEGYVRWQLARTRGDEALAVAMFVHAIDVDDALSDAEKKSDLSRFVLRPVAARYVRLFCARRPSSFVWPASLQPARTLDDACTRGGAAPAELSQFAPLARYDAAVLALDAASDAAYVKLLDAQVDLDAAMAESGDGPEPHLATSGMSAAQIEALARKNTDLSGAARKILDAKSARLAAATAVRKAWLAFDGALDADSELPSSAQMATFALNDVPLTQAARVIAQPDDARAPGRIADIADPKVRAVVAPARMTWARRYLGPLSAEGQLVAAHEVTTRYAADEARTTAFEGAYVAYRQALAGGDAPSVERAQKTAVATAAAMGMYAPGTPRAPLGTTLVDGKSAPPAEIPADGVRLPLL